MEEEIDPALLKTLQYFSMPSPGPVPSVDPADLRSVWNFLQKADLAQKAHDSLPKTEIQNSTQCAYDLLGLPAPPNAGCSPGADIGAVWYRAMMLRLLQSIRQVSQLSRGESPLSEVAGLPDLDYSQPNDAVFKALAIVPMTGLAPTCNPNPR